MTLAVQYKPYCSQPLCDFRVGFTLRDPTKLVSSHVGTQPLARAWSGRCSQGWIKRYNSVQDEFFISDGDDQQDRYCCKLIAFWSGFPTNEIFREAKEREIENSSAPGVVFGQRASMMFASTGLAAIKQIFSKFQAS